MRIGHYTVTLHWRWFDLWVGAYWDRKARVLYVCPLPMVVIRVSLGVPDRSKDEGPLVRELRGFVALPCYMKGCLLEFAGRLRARLEDEQMDPLPDTALIALLCDAGRLAWEYSYRAKRRAEDQ